MNIYRNVIPWLFAVALLASLQVCADEVDELIKQLGGDTFQVRETAQQTLWEMGAAALSAVQEASRSADPEIRRRAAELLPLIEAGVRPDWPEALQQGVLKFDSLSNAGREEFMADLAKDLEEDAVPFLVAQLGGTSSDQARKLLEGLMETHELEDSLILLLSPQPDNADGAILLAAALKKSGKQDADLIALGLKELPETERKRLLNQGVDLLLLLHDEKKFHLLFDKAVIYREQDPDDTRFMYLEGLGAFHLEDSALAESLFGQARERHPEDEVPHYLAAVMLEKTGHDSLAAQEWIKVLQIAPEGEVYDINAYLHLGRINRNKSDYVRAAQAYENALLLYRKAKAHSGGMGMIGASEEDLTKLIAELRSQAKAVDLGKNPLQGNMKVVMKGARTKEMVALAKAADGTLSFTVQPYGLRLIEKAPSNLIFDKEKEELRLTLNGKAFGEGTAYKWKEEKNHILVKTLDMGYIFDLDPETGEGVILEKFELDYRFVITPNETVRALKDQKLIFNGEPVTWEILAEGIPFDYLPEKIEFTMEGVDGKGMNIKAEMNFDPRKDAPEFP